MKTTIAPVKFHSSVAFPKQAHGTTKL